MKSTVLKKPDYELEDLTFLKVRLPVIFKNGSEAEYILLIDSDNRIHYYQVIWKKVYIQITTTESHKETKKNSSAYKFRIGLLEKIGAKHYFSNEHKKEKLLLDNEQIKKMNEYFDEKWHNQTFQNIIYVLTGSNPSGEGNCKQAEVLFNKKAVGLFLQCLNIGSKSHLFYDNEKYKEKFNELSEIKDFDVWLNDNIDLKDVLEKFNSETNIKEWKKTKNEMMKKCSIMQIKNAEYDKFVSEERNKFISSSRKKYQKLDDFWENGKGQKIVYAHIKPVFKIREEIKNQWLKNDLPKNIPTEIADVNNCIPLPDEMHRYYDSYAFYWDENGEITSLIKPSEDLPSTYDAYAKIPQNHHANIRKYILDYIKIANDRKKNYQ